MSSTPSTGGVNSLGALPLPNESQMGGVKVQQKSQKYPERELKIRIEDDFCYNNNVLNAPTQIRLGFIRKVYAILTAQLCATVFVCSIFMLNESAKTFIQSNQWLVFVLAFATLGVLIGMQVNRNKYPTNFILLATFTLMESVMLGSLVTFYDSGLVLEAFAITLSLTVMLMCYASQTKHNYTSCGAALLVSLWLLILAPLFQLYFQSDSFELMVSVGGAGVFCLFIIVDTQLIMAKVSPEEYIVASIELYLDIINLFIYILRILKATRRD
ncbi:protein lifeguard 4-like [Symsagittifera roscoffensis]|uniref:protein lifeguard 4-like n=1 Tax=Symsagittifera roscoffensis TaxID=84072 RepID=UPI00307C9660